MPAFELFQPNSIADAQRLKQWRHIFDELMHLPILVSGLGARLALCVEDTKRFQETFVLQQSFL